MCKVKLLWCLFVLGTSVRAESEGLLYSQGLEIFDKIVKQFLNSQPEDLLIGEGVHLITTKSANEITSRSMKNGGGILSAMENYLKSHEIRIKLPELLPKEGLGKSLKEAIDNTKEDAVTGRGKKGGGGGGGMMIMAMMMGKMMAAMGMAGVGALAAKALMVSALALMLSLIVAAKKLASHGDDGGYHVIHASAHGHHDRRKREASEMAYSSWKSLYNNRD